MTSEEKMDRWTEALACTKQLFYDARENPFSARGFSIKTLTVILYFDIH